MFTVHNYNKHIVPIPYKPQQKSYISNSGEPVEFLFDSHFAVDLVPTSYISTGDTVTGAVRYNRSKTTTNVVMASRQSDATYIIVRVPDYVV